MQQADLTAIARRLATSLRGANDAFCLQIVRLLAFGRPVSREQLAAALHVPLAEIHAVLRQLSDVEFDESGNIVGWGLTLIPTPHRFQINGQTLFTWCALDALTYPALLHLPARVASPCPITSTQVTFFVTSEGIKDLEPTNAVVSLVIPELSQTCDCCREDFCDQVHFFNSLETASVWQASHREALILSVDDAYQIGQMVAKYRYETLF